MQRVRGRQLGGDSWTVLSNRQGPQFPEWYGKDRIADRITPASNLGFETGEQLWIGKNVKKPEARSRNEERPGGTDYKRLRDP
jgi:hypothetical protein